MTTEPDPTPDDFPLESAVKAEAEAEVAEAEAAARPPRPPLEPRVQLAVGAGLAVAIIGLIGTLVGAWSLSFSGAILIAAGLIAAGAAYLSSGREPAPTMIPLRDLILGGGEIAAVLGVLFTVQILTVLDDLDDFGGGVGLFLTVALGVAGVALYVAATQWWTGGPLAPWTTAMASGDRATRLVLAGAAVVLVGWLGNITFGFWFLEAGSEVITFVLFSALVMRCAADPDQPLRLPLPAAFVALASGILAAIIAIQHTGRILERGAGLDDWLPQLVYVAGVVIVLVGAGIGSAEGSRTLTEGQKGAAPPA